MQDKRSLLLLTDDVMKDSVFFVIFRDCELCIDNPQF